MRVRVQKHGITIATHEVPEDGAISIAVDGGKAHTVKGDAGDDVVIELYAAWQAAPETDEAELERRDRVARGEEDEITSTVTTDGSPAKRTSAKRSTAKKTAAKKTTARKRTATTTSKLS